MITKITLYSFCKMLNPKLWGRTFFWTFIFVHFQKSPSTFFHVFSKNQNRRVPPTIFINYY